MISMVIFLYIYPTIIHSTITSDCASNTCLAENATKIWNNDECAELHQETNCQSCHFRTTSLFLHKPFYSEKFHPIQSLIVRPGCRVEKHTSGAAWLDQPWTYTYNGVHNNIDPSYHHKDAENFTCSCRPNSGNSNGTTILTPRTTLQANITTTSSSTTDLATSEIPTTSRTSSPTTSEPEWPEGMWCAYIKTAVPPRSDVYLIQNNATEPEVFEKIRKGKLKNAWFIIGKTYIDPNKCVLEICGFSPTATEPYKHGTCEKYTGDSRLAPSHIYLDDYEVSSASCSCRSTVIGNCAAETCLSQNATKIWKAGECAELYQEKNCQTCYYQSISMFHQIPFFSLHFFQIKSLNVRPGCRVERWTNGVLEHDQPFIYLYEEARKDIDPSYHRDSENFTCSCDFDSGEEEYSGKPASLGRIQKALKITQAVSFAVGLASILLLALVLIKRNINTKSSEGGEVLDILQNTSQVQISSVQMYDLESPNNHFKEIHQSISSNKDEASCIISSANDIADASLPAIKEKLDDDQLKTEIMEEVKTMIETIFASLGGYDAMIQYSEQIQTNSPQTENSQDSEFAALLARFQEICSPQHIIDRNSFSIPNKNLESPLGDGMSGIVYKGILNDIDGFRQPVAIKKIKWPCSKQNVIQSFLREVQTFETIENESEFIVQFLGACCHYDGLYVLTAFCELGSLEQYLEKEMRPRIFQTDVNDFQNIPLKTLGDNYFISDDQEENKLTLQTKNRLSHEDLLQLILWCEQTASGLEFLSRKRIIHVDVAIRNLLLSAGKIIKICDFGLSRKCSTKDYCARTFETGEFPFNSFVPELITKNIDEPRQLSLYVDIWAFGCTVYQIFTLGGNLYPDIEETGIFKGMKIRKKLLEGYRHPDPPLAPYYVCEVLKKCWEEVPQSRPKFAELKNLFQGWRMQLEESANMNLHQ